MTASAEKVFACVRFGVVGTFIAFVIDSEWFELFQESQKGSWTRDRFVARRREPALLIDDAG